MESNVYLKSNIYPAIKNDNKEGYEKYILYSEDFLSNIQSSKKRDVIRKKHELRSLPLYWSKQQQEFFESDENNPNIGIILRDHKQILITDNIIPKENYIKYDPLEYDYKYSFVNYDLNDLLIEKIDNYEYKIDINENPDIQMTENDSFDLPKFDSESIFSAISEFKKQNVKTTEIENEQQQDEEHKYISESAVQSYQINNNIFSKFAVTEQRDIIEADFDNVIFVDAGPGTGKTYTLIQRIIFLIEKAKVLADSMMILCFTNAAVNEIKERLNIVIKNGGDRSLANVDIRTFHSFSWWLINQANELKWENINLHNMNYEQSIRKASEILKNQKYYTQIVGNWKHFIVDEIQDLTNSLARFVLYIINACLESKNIGITVLGDSCQAIYDYTLKEEKQIPLSSQDFYNALARKIEEIGIFVKLTENHRQIGNLANFSINYRNSILSQNIGDIKNEVKNISNSIEPLFDDILTNVSETTIKKINNNISETKICFTCRNNGQTLKLSSIFRKKGIKHTLNVNVTENNYASWISDIFYDFNEASIDRNNFLNRFNRFVNIKNFEKPETIWDKMIFLTKSDDSVYISELIKIIGLSKKDDTCFRSENKDNIIVSNIHRTKGREYNHVVIDNTFINDLIERQQDIGEYKTLYVALTRFKSSLYSAKLSELRNKGGVYPIDIFKTKRRRYGRMRLGKVQNFEIINDLDISIDSFLTDKAQEYIKNVNIGDPILLKKRKIDNRIIYYIIHTYNDLPTILGQLCDSFKDDLIARMQLSEHDYSELPDTITDLYVSGIYTHISTKEYLGLHPEIKKQSPNGIWKWVEFIGVGYASYDIY